MSPMSVKSSIGGDAIELSGAECVGEPPLELLSWSPRLLPGWLAWLYKKSDRDMSGYLGVGGSLVDGSSARSALSEWKAGAGRVPTGLLA